MPLVDNQTWFGSDTGDSIPIKRRPQQDPGDASPGAGFLFAGPLPSGAPCWDVQQSARMQPRVWHPTPDDSFILSPAVAAPALPWPDQGTSIRRRPWLPATDGGALGLLPPGVISDPAQQFASQQPDNALRLPLRRFVAEFGQGQPSFLLDGVDPSPLRFDESPLPPIRYRRRPAPSGEDVVPIWTFGTGQPVPPVSWGMDTGAGLRRTVAFRPAQETALPPLLAVTDIPVSLVGWRDDAPAMRWRRPAFHAQEMTALPPLVFLDVAKLDASTIQPQADLVRARHWQASAPDDATAVLWWSNLATIDAQGRMSWDAPQPYPRLPRRTAWRDEGAAPVLDASALLAVPWLPIDDGSARRPRSGWQAAPMLDDARHWQAPPWIAAPSVVVVAGPFYVCAGQIWQAGMVDGDILTAE